VLQLHLTEHDAGLAQLEKVLGVGASEASVGAGRGDA